MTVSADEASFEEEVLNSDVPVLVDFWAEWCGPCKMIAPVLEELSTELEGQLKIVKLDVDNNPNIATKYGIMSIPTLVVFKDGAEVSRERGALPKSTLISWLGKELNIA